MRKSKKKVGRSIRLVANQREIDQTTNHAAPLMPNVKGDLEMILITALNVCYQILQPLPRLRVHDVRQTETQHRSFRVTKHIAQGPIDLYQRTVGPGNGQACTRMIEKGLEKGLPVLKRAAWRRGDGAAPGSASCCFWTVRPGIRTGYRL
jgi:hypothetical protein